MSPKPSKPRAKGSGPRPLYPADSHAVRAQRGRVRIEIPITPEDRAAIDAAAEALGMTRSAAIVHLVRRFLLERGPMR